MTWHGTYGSGPFTTRKVTAAGSADELVYVDKHPQPTKGSDTSLPDALSALYGAIDAPAATAIARVHGSGDLHNAVYDHAAGEVRARARFSSSFSLDARDARRIFTPAPGRRMRTSRVGRRTRSSRVAPRAASHVSPPHRCRPRRCSSRSGGSTRPGITARTASSGRRTCGRTSAFGSPTSGAARERERAKREQQRKKKKKKKKKKKEKEKKTKKGRAAAAQRKARWFAVRAGLITTLD